MISISGEFKTCIFGMGPMYLNVHVKFVQKTNGSHTLMTPGGVFKKNRESKKENV